MKLLAPKPVAEQKNSILSRFLTCTSAGIILTSGGRTIENTNDIYKLEEIIFDSSYLQQ